MRIENRNLKIVFISPARGAPRGGGAKGNPVSGEGGGADLVGFDENRLLIGEALRADAAGRAGQIRSLAKATRAGRYRVEAQEVGRAIIEETVAGGGYSPGG